MNEINPIKKTAENHLSGTSKSHAEEEDQTTSETNTTSEADKTYPDAESEYVTLPSQGIFYKGRFKGLAKIKVRKLNYTDEDILTTRSYYDNGTLFNEILKNVIVDTNGFRSEQLVPVDRDAILMWLRIGAFGKDYVIPQECEECTKKDMRTWDLSDIDMPELNKQYEQQLVELGEVDAVLPESGITIKLTVPSTGRELEVEKILTTEKKQLKTDRNHAITGRLLSVISAVVIDGRELRSLKEIRDWMKSGTGLSIRDSRHIQKLAKDIDVKIETKKDFTCKHCGHVEEGVVLPMTIYFFWPEYEKV
jgi:hypothetical protein